MRENLDRQIQWIDTTDSKININEGINPSIKPIEQHIPTMTMPIRAILLELIQKQSGHEGITFIRIVLFNEL